MRKGLLPSLLVSFILLCGCAGPETDPGLALRSRILEKGCCFEAGMAAAYGACRWVFARQCLADDAGNPTKADISCKEQRYLSMVVQNFRTESEPEA